MPRMRMQQGRPRRGLRALAFAVLALAIVGVAASALRPKEFAWIELGPQAVPSAAATHAMPDATLAPAKGSADMTIRIDMAGFTPPDLTVRPGAPTRLLIVNPDNSHHTDGGGWHQLSVPTLGVDFKIPPLTNMVVTLPAAPEGEYAFWCDVCCGGKENPAMQGVLRVRA